jgi:hypothetical protein
MLTDGGYANRSRNAMYGGVFRIKHVHPIWGRCRDPVSPSPHLSIVTPVDMSASCRVSMVIAAESHS